MWACKLFNMYVYGRQFELERDHKPLECIFDKTSKPSTIIERWVLRLHCQNFKVSYRPGKTNIAEGGHCSICSNGRNPCCLDNKRGDNNYNNFI